MNQKSTKLVCLSISFYSRAGLSDHVYCLLDAGADPHQCNKRGLLPLHIACSRPETVKVTWSLINYVCTLYLFEYSLTSVVCHLAREL